MRKNYSIDQLSTMTVRQAQSEMASMQRDLKALRDSISGLNRAIKAPVPKGGSRTIKGSRSSPSILDDLGAFAGASALGLMGLSGASSAAQSASRSLLTLALGQRIR